LDGDLRGKGLPGDWVGVASAGAEHLVALRILDESHGLKAFLMCCPKTIVQYIGLFQMLLAIIHWLISPRTKPSQSLLKTASPWYPPARHKNVTLTTTPAPPLMLSSHCCFSHGAIRAAPTSTSHHSKSRPYITRCSRRTGRKDSDRHSHPHHGDRVTFRVTMVAPDLTFAELVPAVQFQQQLYRFVGRTHLVAVQRFVLPALDRSVVEVASTSLAADDRRWRDRGRGRRWLACRSSGPLAIFPVVYMNAVCV